MTKEQYINKKYSNEDQFTANTHRYINHNYPQLRNFYFHVPNENSAGEKMILKLYFLGTLAGVPDLIFIKPIFWCMELKMPKGVVSEKQKKLHSLWRSINVPIFVCYSPIEVCNALDSIFVL
jgi:hypothetical protein